MTTTELAVAPLPPAADKIDKPARGRAIATRSVGVTIATVVLVALVLGPVGFLVYGSFRSAAPGLAGTWTLDNFAFIGSSRFLKLAWNSLIIGVAGTFFGMGIALILAIAVVRMNVRGSKYLDSLFIVPAYIPAVLIGFGWVWLASPRLGIINAVLENFGLGPINIYSMTGIIAITALTVAPLAYLYIRPALAGLDTSMEEAAWVSGASRARTLWQIVIKLSSPGLLAATLIVFINAFGEFAIPAVLGPPAQIYTISTQLLIFVSSYPADPNKAAVMGLLLMAVSVIGLYLSGRLQKGKSYVTVGSRGSVQRRSTGRPWVRALTLAFCYLYLLLAVVAPMFAIIAGSLQPFLTKDLSAGWTVQNFADLVEFPNIYESIITTFQLALGAAVITLVIAIALTRVAANNQGVLRKLTDYVATFPLAIPGIVYGTALLWMWVQLKGGVYGTKWILLIAYVGLFLPYAMRACAAANEQIDPSLEEAARVAGAGRGRVYRLVIVPLLAPSLLSGGTIVFYHSMKELSASLLLFTSGSAVMSVTMWSLFESGRTGQLFALALVNVLFILVVVGLMSTLAKRVRNA